VVYGHLGLGEHVISGYKIRVASLQDGLSYARVNEKGEVLTSARLVGDIGLTLAPIEPVAGPASNLVECIYVRLGVPVVVDDRVELTILAPVDYGVVAQKGNESQTVIDAFPETRLPYKLALYGPPTQGFICRFYTFTDTDTPGPGLAQVNVWIRNNTGNVARVRSIVLPLTHVRVFYKPGTWIARLSEVRVTLESSNVAKVDVDDNPPSADFDLSPDIISANVPRIAPFARESFTMLWGY